MEIIKRALNILIAITIFKRSIISFLILILKNTYRSFNFNKSLLIFAKTVHVWYQCQKYVVLCA